MKKTYETLEFNTILSLISGYCKSEQAKSNVENLSPIQEYTTLVEQQKYLQEAIDLIVHYGRLPIGPFNDISELVQKTTKDGTLFGEDFVRIRYQLDNVKEILQYIEDKELEDTKLYTKITELYFVSDLYKQIVQCIDASGNILDTASSELRKIRKSILSMEANIRNKIVEMQGTYKELLSQETVASRNNHLVLPVKASNKNTVKGIVHAMSASGQTMFIEPEAVVLMNNQLLHLQSEEKQEIQRILFSLSQLVKQNDRILFTNQEVLISLDELFSKAMYGFSIEGILPEIKEKGREFSLQQARHPLIDKNMVVSNDIMIRDNKTLFLISGSNTGGKTVVLKTAGLLSVMALSGLAIPCSQAVIPLFDEIYVDLGDEQSIEQSLSTFSSHMKRLVEITNHVSSNSLVLLDEIGSGTDPREGESIAKAILSFLHTKNTLTIASTHYSGLKQFAKEKEYTIIAAVEFDQENMKPTYRLLTGNVGNSYAIEISSRLGLKKDIVEAAYQYKDASLSASDKLLEKLQDELTSVQKEKDDLASLKQETDHKLEKYNRLVATLEKQKEQLLKEAKEDANKILEEAKAQINEVVEDLKKQQELKQHIVIDAKRTLDVLKHQDPQVVVTSTSTHQYVLGDRVKILSMNREGEVISITKKGVLTVDIGGIKMNLKPQEIEFVAKKQKIKPVKSNIRSLKKTTNQSYEINVIGQRYEEAMLHVDKFLDDALVQNYSMVRIVHGMGTGALRNGVRKLLDKNKSVISYRDGGPNEGGLGATLVYFE